MSTMFTDVNEKTSEIAAQVGRTPQNWNSSVFSMIQNLSESVVVPIAGIIITLVLCYELISMLTERNNLHDVDTYSVEIWKRFRKWGGIPTGITQNIKDLLASREIENIFENSDFIYMLNQASGDRQILAKQLNISPFQLSYVTNSNEGEGLLFYGNTIIPFKDKFDTSLKLYGLMTTKPNEIAKYREKKDA